MLAQPPSQFHDFTTYFEATQTFGSPAQTPKTECPIKPNSSEKRLTSLVIILAAFVCFALAGVKSAQAATYVVNSTADTDDTVCDNTNCTLREAINAANANSGADTIAFSVTGTILLGSALPDLSDDVTISGPGANVLTVKRDPNASGFRIFIVNSGKTVTISGLTITNGSVVGGFGGGILSNVRSLTPCPLQRL